MLKNAKNMLTFLLLTVIFYGNFFEKEKDFFQLR